MIRPTHPTAGSTNSPRAFGFVRWCLVIALVFNPALTFTRWLVRPGYPEPLDMVQYYLAGRMIWQGHPEAIYPQPYAGSTLNAGFQDGSNWRPTARAEEKKLRLRPGSRFIQPPASAPLFVPLGMMNPRVATVVWLLLLCASQIGIGVVAMMICRRCGGGDVAAGLTLLAVSLAPDGMQGIQVGNLSPLMGLLVGLNLLFLLRHDRVASGVVLAFGLLLKYWNVALIPAYIARRQFRAAAVAVCVGIVICAFSLVTIGVDPYRVYLNDIAPTLARSFGKDNQSLYGFFVRQEGGTISDHTLIFLETVRAVGFLLLAALTWTRRRNIARFDAAAVAITAAWLAWLFVLSPVFWSHYESVVMPAWGWLMTIIFRERGWPRLMAIFAIVATCFASPMFGEVLPRFPDPLALHQSVGLMAIVALAVRELRRFDLTADDKEVAPMLTPSFAA